MKIGIIFCIFFSASLALFFAENVSARSFNSVMSGDIFIQTLSNGSVYCDTMICPQGSSCRVTKRNDPNDLYIIVRHRMCFDSKGECVQEEKVNEKNPYGGIINTNVSGGGGREMTPEEQKQLQEYLQQTQQRIQAQIQSSLGPFLDGSFAANLNRQIQNSIRFS